MALSIREEICAVGRKLSELQLVVAHQGNISARIDQDRIVCTPTGVRKGEITPDSLAVMTLKGVQLNGPTVSSEVKMHLGLYRERPDCQAVVHAHPIAATGFALAGVVPDAMLMPEAISVLGPICLVPFAMPGTEEVPQMISEDAADHKTFLLANHGAVTIGTSPTDALLRMETLEHFCRILLSQSALSAPVAPPAHARRVLQEQYGHGRL